jgi:hypothetical protein
LPVCGFVSVSMLTVCSSKHYFDHASLPSDLPLHLSNDGRILISRFPLLRFLDSWERD